MRRRRRFVWVAWLFGRRVLRLADVSPDYGATNSVKRVHRVIDFPCNPLEPDAKMKQVSLNFDGVAEWCGGLDPIGMVERFPYLRGQGFQIVVKYPRGSTARLLQALGVNSRRNILQRRHIGPEFSSVLLHDP
jgi:hypothetical protein